MSARANLWRTIFCNSVHCRIHVMYGILRATGLLFDVWVWYWAANLLMMKEPDNKKGKKKSKSSVVAVE